jgi:hypothetical protein
VLSLIASLEAMWSDSVLALVSGRAVADGPLRGVNHSHPRIGVTSLFSTHAFRINLSSFTILLRILSTFPPLPDFHHSVGGHCHDGFI